MFLRKFVRSNKNDDLVEKVELTHVNPTYAYIRHNDGRESAVSLSDLAPCPDNQEKEINIQPENSLSFQNEIMAEDPPFDKSVDKTTTNQIVESEFETLSTNNLRRSTRIKRKPQMYGFEDDS